MKHIVMARSKPPPATSSPHRVGESAGAPDAAFDVWLHRSLHQLFDRVAREPIPEELIRLIEQDRAK